MSNLRGAELKRWERLFEIAYTVMDEAPEEITPGVNAPNEYREMERRALDEGLIAERSRYPLPTPPPLRHESTPDHNGAT